MTLSLMMRMDCVFQVWLSIMRFAPALLHLPLQACGTGHFCSAGTKVVSITRLGYFGYW